MVSSHTLAYDVKIIGNAAVGDRHLRMQRLTLGDAAFDTCGYSFLHVGMQLLTLSEVFGF